ncbi:MAG TPA: hypothetical protein VGY54_18025, partial [Polyangiaceae bacterium]|nr:hypothetical protein [Polyangiaceae bacterium]
VGSVRRSTVSIRGEGASRITPIHRNLAMWQRISAVACSILMGPILLLSLALAAFLALPAIALALPLFVASVWQCAKGPARVRLVVGTLPLRTTDPNASEIQ